MFCLVYPTVWVLVNQTRSRNLGCKHLYLKTYLAGHIVFNPHNECVELDVVLFYEKGNESLDNLPYHQAHRQCCPVFADCRAGVLCLSH